MTSTLQSVPVDLLPRGDEFPTIARRVETVCPYCGVGCGVVLDLDAQGRIVQVEDAPCNLSSDGMLCVKGRYGLGFVHAPDRLTTPLIRNQEDGLLQPATWDDALDLTARELAARVGKVAVFGSAKATNEDGYLLQKFARAILGTNNVDHCARLCHSSSMAGMAESIGSGSTTNSYSDFEIAGSLLIAGSDTDVNHPVIAARIRRGIAENGVKLIVVNPRRTRLAAEADHWLQVRPGTDVALFNGLARAVLDDGLEDQAFIDNRTENVDEWLSVIRAFSVEQAAGVSGISADDIRAAARLFARPAEGRNSSILWGMGSTQHTRGVQIVQSMVNLVLVTGNIGKPGSGLSPLRGQNNVQGACDMALLPDTLPGYQGLTDASRTKFETAWGHPVPEKPGLKMTEVINACLAGEITALFVEGENPLLAEANLNHATESIAKLEFLAVQTAFLNEITDFADVVLPATVFAEKDGTFTNSERRVQRVRKATDAPGQAREDWAITAELAVRTARYLGLPETGFSYEHPSAIWDEIASLLPSMAGISYDRIDARGIQWPCSALDHPGTPLLFTETFPRGRAKFVPVTFEFQAEELPDTEFPLLLNTGRVLYHWHGGDMTRRVDGLMEAYPAVEVSINPTDATRMGIRPGDHIRVASRRGTVEASANVTPIQREGEVFIPFVQLAGAAANRLTNNALDPRSRIPEYKVCAVRIEPLVPSAASGKE